MIKDKHNLEINLPELHSLTIGLSMKVKSDPNKEDSELLKAMCEKLGRVDIYNDVIESINPLSV